MRRWGQRQLVFIILIGLFITAFGVYITNDQIDFLSKSASAEATVVGFHEEVDGGGRISYFPVFQFVDSRTGYNVTAWGSLGQSNNQAYSVGQEVEILYNTENPTVGVITNSFVDKWLFSIISLPLGLALLIIGIIVLMRMRADNKQSPQTRGDAL
jgi:hypothetical protein